MIYLAILLILSSGLIVFSCPDEHNTFGKDKIWKYAVFFISMALFFISGFFLVSVNSYNMNHKNILYCPNGNIVECVVYEDVEDLKQDGTYVDFNMKTKHYRMPGTFRELK